MEELNTILFETHKYSDICLVFLKNVIYFCTTIIKDVGRYTVISTGFAGTAVKCVCVRTSNIFCEKRYTNTTIRVIVPSYTCAWKILHSVLTVRYRTFT